MTEFNNADPVLGKTHERAWLALLARLFWSSSTTTFRVLPATAVLVESLRQRRLVLPRPAGVPFLVWGYAQYQMAGRYRSRLGGGNGGMSGTPDALVTSGAYRRTRNPMYLGHLIFSLGLVTAYPSPFTVLLALNRAVYFQLRVWRDEARLDRLFGTDYAAYKQRVPRWVPGFNLRRLRSQPKYRDT